MVAYEDTAAAIDWLIEAFGFVEHGERYVMEDGTIGHAELELGGEIVMLATPNREYQSPRTHREACASTARWLDNPYVIDGVHVEVDDVDAHHARAVAAGATSCVRRRSRGSGSASTPPRISKDIAGCSRRRL